MVTSVAASATRFLRFVLALWACLDESREKRGSDIVHLQVVGVRLAAAPARRGSLARTTREFDRRSRARSQEPADCKTPHERIQPAVGG
jgi:hypothetical protein